MEYLTMCWKKSSLFKIPTLDNQYELFYIIQRCPTNSSIWTIYLSSSRKFTIHWTIFWLNMPTTRRPCQPLGKTNSFHLALSCYSEAKTPHQPFFTIFSTIGHLNCTSWMIYGSRSITLWQTFLYGNGSRRRCIVRIDPFLRLHCSVYFGKRKHNGVWELVAFELLSPLGRTI